MRVMIKEFVGECAAILPFDEPIYEFGAFQVPGQESIADMRPFFPGRRYIGSDMRPGQGVDLLLNLHDLALPDATVGAALLLDTLEHVEYPHRAVAEVHRVLKPGGVALLSSVMRFPIHGHPDDYWRFTPSAFQSLVKPFDWSLVLAVGEPDFPHTVVAVARKGPLPAATESALAAALRPWQQRWFYQHEQPSRLDLLLRDLAPPLLLRMIRRLRGMPAQI